ncbi:hypothetical protein [Thalassococcus sp. S3]|uniref:hypothetical protein n=1 Tax=Thalassococcus sp. S3 TaxID=2017482 RepID=UPI0020C32FC0|nr:hypothetical protein [Thalassococcus sp. S3]
MLQKAIRRNRPHAARQAGRFLLAVNGNTLLRRLNAIAAEDIGLADIHTVGIAAACLARKTIRRQLGGDALVTDYLIRRMCDARKSRAADDLLMAIETWPDLSGDRTRFAEMSNNRLRSIVLGCRDLDRKALALWYLVGTRRCASDHLTYRVGDPAIAFQTLSDLGVAPTLVAIAQENFTKTQSMLAPFVALLSLENDIVATGVGDDQTPVEDFIGDVPSWAHDQYTRPGKMALRRLCSEEAGMVEWLHAHVPSRSRLKVAGELLFRVEGQCLSRRADGPLSLKLRERWVSECLSLPPDVTRSGMAAMLAAIPTLNQIRKDVLTGVQS